MNKQHLLPIFIIFGVLLVLLVSSQTDLIITTDKEIYNIGEPVVITFSEIPDTITIFAPNQSFKFIGQVQKSLTFNPTEVGEHTILTFLKNYSNQKVFNVIELPQLEVTVSTDKSYYELGEKVLISITGDPEEFEIISPSNVFRLLESRPEQLEFNPPEIGEYTINAKDGLKLITVEFRVGIVLVVENITDTQIIPVNETNESNIFKEYTQGPAEVNRPVKWTRKIIVNDSGSEILKLPKGAKNVKILKDKRNIAGFGINAINEIILPQEPGEYEIEFETIGPETQEKIITPNRKTVSINSEINYTNVSVSTSINEVPIDGIQINHLLSEGPLDIISDPRYKVEFFDKNNDGLIDELKWIVPHLSNQTFEITITIINPVTFLRDGDTWIVEFNTTGEANLTIESTNSDWDEILVDNPNTSNILKFIDLSCGLNSLNQSLIIINETGTEFTYSALDFNSSFEIKQFRVQNYSCNETGYFETVVHIAGFAELKFDFGGKIGFALDPLAPNITNPGFNVTYINQSHDARFNVTITDPTGINTSLIQVLFPNASVQNFTLDITGPEHYHNFINNTEAGIINVTLIWSNNTDGNISQSVDPNIYFEVNLSYPKEFQIQTPLNDTHSTNQFPTMTWQRANDEDFVNYSLLFATNETFEAPNLTFYTFGVTNTSFTLDLPLVNDTKYYWRVTATDIWGAERNSTNFSLYTIDTIAPNLTLNQPLNNSFEGAIEVRLNYTPTEINFGNCTLFDNFTGVWAENETDLDPRSQLANFFVLNFSEGSFLWNVRCTDRAGNSNYSENNFTFTVDVSPPLISNPVASPPSPTIFSSGSLNLLLF